MSRDFSEADFSLNMYNFAASESWFEEEYFEIPESGFDANEFSP